MLKFKHQKKSKNRSKIPIYDNVDIAHCYRQGHKFLPPSRAKTIGESGSPLVFFPEAKGNLNICIKLIYKVLCQTIV